MIDGACGPAVCDNRLESLRQRFERLPAASIVQKLRTEAGTFADYKHLSRFHYKSGQPGAVTTVYRLVYRAPTVIGRFRRRHNETTVVGVLLRSLPSLGCQLRDYTTSYRYRGIGAKATAAMLNHEFRTIRRVVIDPRWRGLGLAVQLVRHALEHPETIFTEALAVMGRVHPFFERAGMARYDRPPRPEYARLIDAFDRLEISPGLLACRRLVRDALDKHCREDQRWIEMELRRWHRTAFRTPKHRLNALALDDLLVAARDRLMAQPVYFLYHHNDTEA